MRLGFWLPDIAAPTGGLSAAYRFARYLHEDGRDVCVIHSNARFANRFEDLGSVRTESLKRARATFGVDDVVVVPEMFAGSPIVDSIKSRLIVVNQNPFLTGPAAATDRTYLATRTLGVVATSGYTEAYLGLRFPTVRSARIVLGIDSERFCPSSARADVPRLISWMPRKRRADAELVLDVLRRELAHESWTIQPIDGLTQEEVAVRLGRSSVYLALGEREGFGLPVAEAMACGAACVGFAGVGGTEILSGSTGWLVPESDVAAFVETALAVCALIEQGDPSVGARTSAARELMTSRYNRRTERATTLAAFGELLSAADGAGRAL